MHETSEYTLYAICEKREYWLKGEFYRSAMQPGVNNAVIDVEGYLDEKDIMI